MRKFCAGLALAALALAACAKDPALSAGSLLKKGDRMGALKVLEEARDSKPERLPARYALFLLYRLLAAQGDPARSDAWQAGAIKEYEAIAKAQGLALDYKDMEGSLKGNPASRAAFDEAYALVMGR
jgi:hypothetical protein